MHILFVGDIVGRPGRRALFDALPRLREDLAIDLVVANGENAAGGLGITPAILRELLSNGVDAVTLGNHTWRKQELAPELDAFDRVARPANYPPGAPGRGALLVPARGGRQVGVVSVIGRVYMEPSECPFRVAEAEVARLRESTPFILVDIHAEATSEKIAMGWFLDGKCTAVVGTHTHVATADERVLPKGTAYITDVGMTGPMDSVLGVERDRIIQKFLTGMPTQHRISEERPMVNAVLIDADDETGRARAITRIQREKPRD